MQLACSAAFLFATLPLMAQVEREPGPEAGEAGVPAPDSGDPGPAGFGKPIDDAISAFLELKDGEQAEVLAAVRSAVDAIESPWLASVRAHIAKARAAAAARPRHRAGASRADWKLRKGGDPQILLGLRFPVANQYLFGQGVVIHVDSIVGEEELDALLDERQRRHAASVRKRRLRAKGLIEAPAYLGLRALLRGYPPDMDLCLAAIHCDLDHDRQTDGFSLFLDEWRNGPESFYRALDRTAGTKDSVFFYDAMLGEYIARFVPKTHDDYKAIRRSTDAAHDALHKSFLAYRQYRALRECLALSLLLPPDARLPGSLERYEEIVHQGYSVRSMLTLFLHAEKQDIAKVVAILASTAPPMPEYLWIEEYDPFPPLHQAFDDRLPAMKATGRHSDELLQEQNVERARIGRECATAARVAFLAAMKNV